MVVAALWLLLILFIREVNSHVVPGVEEDELDVPFVCGYEACPAVKDGMINVHVVPYSHNGAGWLKTVEQHFFRGGNKFDISMEDQKAQLSALPFEVPYLSRKKPTADTDDVEQILDSVMDSLHGHAKRRFVYVETGNFWKWWNLQNATRQHQVRDFVEQGRLEFIGGGWTMNDEAVTHYQSIIDQMTWGLRRLNDTFGECGRPRVGWQIDPFGHSREMASILAQMGYDGLFLGHVHYQDKANILSTKRTEMMWICGLIGEMFTHILYNQYAPPNGFCFDTLCNDDPIVDDITDKNYNVPERVEHFLKLIQHQAEFYNTNHLIMTMESDFTYGDAERWFTNLDKLIKHTNVVQSSSGAGNVNVLYSTPSCYLKAVNDANFTWCVKTGDFFPYASEPHVYWTGYYSSRPTLKYLERLGNNFLQVSKQLYALSNLGPENEVSLNSLREAMGFMQHHDAITGTSKQNVVNDYTRMLSEAMHKCSNVSSTALGKLMAETETSVPLWESCLHLNESRCSPSEESENFVVTVFNPLAQEISSYVRIPVSGDYYHVQDSAGDNIVNQVVPIPDSVLKIPGRVSPAVNELIFQAENLQPLGFHSYFISEKRIKEDSTTSKTDATKSFDTFGHENHHYKGNRFGDLRHLRTQGVKFRAEISYHFYETSDTSPHFHKAGGAYIFRPNSAKPKIVPPKNKFRTYKGPLVSERHEVFSDWLSHVVRIYDNELYTEVEWLVGPLPTEDYKGKEVIVKYTTNLQSEGTFFTDSNGHLLIKRSRNNLPTRHFELEDRTAGNYYPVTNSIVLRDYNTDLEFCVLIDRAQGGSSLHDGQLELMLHRRLITHDSHELNETLSEEAFGKGLVVRGKHYLVGGRIGTNLTMYQKELSWEKLMAPWLFFTRANEYTYNTWSEKFAMEYKGMNNSLPSNIHLLTLEPWKENSILLRFEHLMEQIGDSEEAVPVTLLLKDLFAPFEIISAKETTLGANQWKSDTSQLQWKIKDYFFYRYNSSESTCNYMKEPLSITINPTQICTLIARVKYTKKQKISYQAPGLDSFI